MTIDVLKQNQYKDIIPVLFLLTKPGFCFIHGSCVADGFQKRCYECDIQRNVFEWTFRESEKGIFQ